MKKSKFGILLQDCPLDDKIKFDYLIELGNTTSGWTTGDDVHKRAKGGGGVVCSVNVCVCVMKLWRKRLQMHIYSFLVAQPKALIHSVPGRFGSAMAKNMETL